MASMRPTPTEAELKAKSTNVRWIVLGLLTGFSLVSYVERMNISIAAKFMIPEFSLSEIQMGQVFSSFMVGYALFQVPAGILGDRLGPRFVLSASAFLWAVTTLLTGLLPGILIKRTLAIFISLLLLRFLLGVGEATTYPVAARAIGDWLPFSQHALAYSIVVTGLSLGSAATPPLVSWLMVKLGWRESFYITSVLAFLIAVLWWFWARDHPAQHPRVNERELAIIGATPSNPARNPACLSWQTLLRNRNIGLLSLSYFVNGYVLFMFVFWFYLYLVEVRGFSVLRGGILASLPFIASGILTPTGGGLCDLASGHLGRRWGRRLVVMVGFGLSAIFLCWGAEMANAYRAVIALSLSVGCIEFTEGAFWSTAIDISGEHAGAVSGIMNMLGNFGGAASTALVPVLVKYFGWVATLGVGSALGVAGGLLWLGIQADRSK